MSKVNLSYLLQTFSSIPPNITDHNCPILGPFNLKSWEVRDSYYIPHSWSLHLCPRVLLDIVPQHKKQPEDNTRVLGWLPQTSFADS